MMTAVLDRPGRIRAERQESAPVMQERPRQPVPAEPAAAPAITVRPGLAAVPACPGDDLLPGRGLGRWAGHRQHRTWAVTLAVRPRRGRLAVTRARLLVDSAQRGAVGVRPGQLPGRYRTGAVDPRPSRAPDGCQPHVHHAAGQPGRGPPAGRRADRAGRAGTRAVAQRPDWRDGRRRSPGRARRRFRAELHAHPAVAPAAAVAADRRRHDQRAVHRASGAGRAGMRRGGWSGHYGADVRPRPAMGGTARVPARGTGAGRHAGGGAGTRRHAGRAGRQRGRPDVAVLLPARHPAT